MWPDLWKSMQCFETIVSMCTHTSVSAVLMAALQSAVAHWW